MPFGGAQVIIQMVDFDEGDDTWYGTWLDMWEAINERMISFQFSDHERKKDELKLRFRNDDFAMLENPVFTKGQKLLVTWGWPGQMAVPRRVVVVKVKGGNPLEVTAHDTSTLLDKEKKSRDWENATASEVVREIAGEYGYHGQFLHVEETTDRTDICQDYRTDARFLARLARDYGFEFYIDQSGLHWHKRKLEADPVRTFIYRTDPDRGDIIDEPRFDVNLSKGVSKIKVVARDPRTKELWEVYGGPDDTEVVSLGLEDEAGDPDQSVAEQGLRASRVARLDVRNVGVMTKEQAQANADARYREVVKGKYKMSLNVIGDARVGAKALIDVYGIAESWDGLHYVKECISRVEGGKFTQSLKCEKDQLRKVQASKKKGRGSKEKTNAQTASGEVKEEVGALRRKRVLTTDAEGKVILANYWVDETGTTVGDVDYETSAFFDQETDLEIVAVEGAQSVQPDAGT
jgi:hypothetical protein